MQESRIGRGPGLAKWNSSSWDPCSCAPSKSCTASSATKLCAAESLSAFHRAPIPMRMRPMATLTKTAARPTIGCLMT